jgi:deazaflavin-dependent oxidoreductase (nitroreductase family)
MLTTTGRRTGDARSVLVNHVTDGDGFLVVGSNWGYEAPPAWVLNLQANPAATVTIPQQAIPVTAEFLDGEPRDSAWTTITNRFPQMNQVAASTARGLPVIRLAPT